MTIKKQLVILAISSGLIVTLAGCGTATSDDVVAGSGGEAEINYNDKTVTGIVAGELTPNIITVDNEIGKYIFSIQNNKTEDVKIEMKSSQEYDFHIKDTEGNILHTYSANKSFLMMISEEVLIPGEKMEFSIDLAEYLPSLNAGTYTIEIWPAVVGLEDIKTSVKFNYNGDYEATSDLPSNEIIEGETSGSKGQNDLELERVTEGTGTLIGQIDVNSVEIKTATGIKAYKLTEDITVLPDGTEVNFAYKDIGEGQLELTYMSEK